MIALEVHTLCKHLVAASCIIVAVCTFGTESLLQLIRFLLAWAPTRVRCLMIARTVLSSTIRAALQGAGGNVIYNHCRAMGCRCSNTRCKQQEAN